VASRQTGGTRGDDRREAKAPAGLTWWARCCALLAWGCPLVLPGTVTFAHAEEASAPTSITVVTDDNHPPYVFRDEEGAAHGYLVDLWALWSEANHVEVKLEVLDTDGAKRRVLDGTADVLDAIFQSPEHDRAFDLGPPYASVPVSIYTDRAVGPLTNVGELSNFNVGVKAGDACSERLAQQRNVRVVSFESYRALIMAAKQGEVPAFCMAEAPADYYFYLMKVQHRFTRGFTYFQARMHFGVRKGNTAMLQRVADGMERIDKDAITALNAKWLGSSFGPSSFARYAGYVLLVGAIFAVMLTVWIFSLRKAVKNQTAELEREKANLHESEERFRRLFEDTHQAIALVEHGTYVAANAATLKLLGMTNLDQLIGRSPLDISSTILPDGRVSAHEVPKIIEAAYRDGAHEFEWVHVRGDGGPVDVRVMLTLIRVDQRDLLHVVWTDISAQKRAEAEGKRLNEDLEARVEARTAELARMTESLSLVNREQQAIFDATTVGVMFVVKRKIMRCNRAMETLFGHSSEEMVGQTTRMLYPNQEIFEAVGELVAEKLRTEGRFVEETEMIRADGKVFFARLSAQRLADDVPSAGYVTIIEDATAERNAFRAMQKAKMMAEEATRLKSDFVANMSHEIRTPMTAILGMTELVLQDGLPPRQEAYLRKIEGAGKHLLSLLNDILDFSKIEAGKMIIEHVNFALCEVLDRVTAIIGEQARAKGLAFKVTVADDVPGNLVGDPVRIAQVLTNYATNAVKFTEAGQIDVNVTVVAQQANEIDIRFSVRDTGCGLDTDQCLRLFSSFQQADSSITRKHGGTGLGLAISRQLAEHMHGSVGVHSAPGNGSEFWFTVRVGLGTAPDEAVRGCAGVQRPRPHQAKLSALRLLLVEDNPLNQEVALALLGHFGILADLADNGAIAVEKVQQAQYDLVLMDMQMPVMDGLAATRAIRALPGGQTLPIVAMTANAMASDRQICLAAGMNDHLGKPIDIDQLIARISRWTNVVTAGDASSPDSGPSEALDVAPPAAEVVTLPTKSAAPLLNIEAGLRRSLNREALYVRTLKSFLTHFSNAADKLADALAATDMAALTLAAHSLKGAAGQIGADQLSECARELEASAKSAADEDTLAAQLACVRETTAATLTMIAGYLDSHDRGNTEAVKH